MRYKFSFVVGFGLGYLFGSRAGRERYESIMRTAQKVKDNPTVQSTAGVLQAQAGNVYTTARERIVAARHRDEEKWEYDGMSRVNGSGE